MEAPIWIAEIKRLHLTSQVKQLIWNKLVSLGLDASNPTAPPGYSYQEFEVLNMRE